MERIKPYCRFPSGKGIAHQIQETKTFTPKEGSFLDTFLKQVNSQIQQIYETDRDVRNHIIPDPPSPGGIMAHSVQQGKISMSEYLKFLKNKKK